MNDRWGISIDIEGFSTNFENSEDRKTYAILAIGELMSAIYRIGSCYYPGTPENNFCERLFAHQFGDGFLVCSDFHEPDVSRAIAIAVALMRHMTLNGYAAKSAISTGDLSDINGCYPQPMRSAPEDRLDMGMGLMTIISVMGTALTKAHKLGGGAKGAVLVVDKHLMEKGLPEGIKICHPSGNCIDWISSNLPLADEIAQRSQLSLASTDELCAKLKAYCGAEPVPPSSWIKATLGGVSCNGEKQSAVVAPSGLGWPFRRLAATVLAKARRYIRIR
ncbi:hypothetical protein [Litchfieldella rifensis]|uniref:Uncharacterized protein n=1 Tax=Litchfieldella rifensis TaxID=762643 RepID=A0ABV7LPH9_9GAMM